jgi:hypothetical protein
MRRESWHQKGQPTFKPLFKKPGGSFSRSKLPRSALLEQAIEADIAESIPNLYTTKTLLNRCIRRLTTPTPKV